ncbi:MAG: site-specific DNA-methyltransferase, partial [Bacteroidales bacterium]|nr:site-specific DNA-methyltransferase [Bacteroidales bacterium]
SKSQKYYFDQEAIQEKSTYFDTDNRHITGPTVGGKSLNGVYAINKSGVYQSSGMKNKRSVWTVNLQPTSEAHFAVFPQKLIEPMIRAGCPKGGIVLDPFIGSGTTGIVARKLDRNFIGIELNPEYVKLAEKRIKRKLGIFL